MKTNKEIEAMLFINAFKKANREFEADDSAMAHFWAIVAPAVCLVIYVLSLLFYGKI